MVTAGLAAKRRDDAHGGPTQVREGSGLVGRAAGRGRRAIRGTIIHLARLLTESCVLGLQDTYTSTFVLVSCLGP